MDRLNLAGDGVTPRHVALIPTRVLVMLLVVGAALLAWRSVCWAARGLRALYWPPRALVVLPPYTGRDGWEADR